jgi:hypothetical protein
LDFSLAQYKYLVLGLPRIGHLLSGALQNQVGYHKSFEELINMLHATYNGRREATVQK